MITVTFIASNWCKINRPCTYLLSWIQNVFCSSGSQLFNSAPHQSAVQCLSTQKKKHKSLEVVWWVYSEYLTQSRTVEFHIIIHSQWALYKHSFLLKKITQLIDKLKNNNTLRCGVKWEETLKYNTWRLHTIIFEKRSSNTNKCEKFDCKLSNSYLKIKKKYWQNLPCPGKNTFKKQ